MFKKDKILMYFGIITIISAVLIYMGDLSSDLAVKKDKEKQIDDEIEELMKEPIYSNEEHYVDNVEKSVVDGKVLERTDAYERLVGVIRSDKIGLKEPIYKGASEVNMRKGVATLNVDDDLDQNLLGISGHRSPVRYQYFSEVPKLKDGDFVYIDKYDNTGKIGETKYRVTKKYDLDPSDRETLDKPTDEKTLRMVTCDVWNPKTKTYDRRLITEAVEVKE